MLKYWNVEMCLRNNTVVSYLHRPHGRHPFQHGGFGFGLGLSFLTEVMIVSSGLWWNLVPTIRTDIYRPNLKYSTIPYQIKVTS